jgi:hypothetical protein
MQRPYVSVPRVNVTRVNATSVRAPTYSALHGYRTVPEPGL